MKTVLYLFVSLLFCVTAQNTNAQDDDWEILLDEQFDGNSTKFWTGNDGTLDAKLLNGRYIISYNDAKNPNFVKCTFQETNLKPTDDYMIELSLTLLEGGRDKKTGNWQGFGFVWGWADWDNNLRLLIAGDDFDLGNTTIGGKIAGSDIIIKKWGMASGIKAGYSPNKIILLKEYGYLKVFYGSYYQGKSPDDINTAQDLMGNQVGFYIPNGCKIAVDYITVKRKSVAMKNAIAKYDQKDYSGAATDFSNIIVASKQRNKTLSKAYAYRAACYLQQNMRSIAMLDCNEAIAIDPSNQWAYYIKGYIHSLLDEKTKALEALAKSGSYGKELMEELTTPQENINFKGSGSGFALSSNGYVATNWHVVDEAKSIVIQVNRNGEAKDYSAKIVYADKTNDLAILKIDDPNFSSLGKIPYTVKKQMLDVGTSIFAMGYPLLSSLGEEVKLTDGLISSKTGYQGDIVTYQISAPIQPGNSGGPLFDKKGNLVGITNAGIPNAENVGYAIKANYLVNLLEMLPETVQLPTVNTLQNLPFTSQVKELSKFVFIIKVK